MDQEVRLSVVASMRPGQAAPDEVVQRGHGQRDWVGASMRPGQAAPDEGVAAMEATTELGASMRPGQAAPDEVSCRSRCRRLCRCFNEAGASSPG